MSNILETNLETFQNKQVCPDTCTAQDPCSVKRSSDVIIMDFTRRRMMTGNCFPIKPAFTGQSWQEPRHLNQSGWKDDIVPINHLFISDNWTSYLVFFFFLGGLWHTDMSVLTWTQFKCSSCCQVRQGGFVSKLVLDVCVHCSLGNKDSDSYGFIHKRV